MSVWQVPVQCLQAGEKCNKLDSWQDKCFHVRLKRSCSWEGDAAEFDQRRSAYRVARTSTLPALHHRAQRTTVPATCHRYIWSCTSGGCRVGRPRRGSALHWLLGRFLAVGLKNNICSARCLDKQTFNEAMTCSYLWGFIDFLAILVLFLRRHLVFFRIHRELSVIVDNVGFSVGRTFLGIGWTFWPVERRCRFSCWYIFILMFTQLEQIRI